MTNKVSVGQVRTAQTPRGTRVLIEVTCIDKTDERGTYVWGHRQYRGRRAIARQTLIPNSYFIPAGA